jgi:hypothetical protein
VLPVIDFREVANVLRYHTQARILGANAPWTQRNIRKNAVFLQSPCTSRTRSRRAPLINSPEGV